MTGGGAVAGRVDPEFWPRGSAIRGALRAWWRATRGAGYPDSRFLYDKEREIWGDADHPSPVRLRVDVKTAPLLREDGLAALRGPGGRRPRHGVGGTSQGKADSFLDSATATYVFFPALQSPDPAARRVLVGGRFHLSLEFPSEFKKDVEAALWGWVNFGGLGARTRRGFGSLHAPEVSPRLGEEIGAWFARTAGEYGVGGQGRSPRPWETLSARLYWQEEAADPMRAWNEAAGFLRAFRQPETTSRSGDLRWPEAAAIRQIRAQSPPSPEEAKRHVFPRAVLGLPVPFHMKEDGDRSDGPILLPIQGDRMASPVIVKALAVTPPSGGSVLAVPACLLLRAPLPERAHLRLPEVREPVKVRVALREADAVAATPLRRPRDALAALQDELQRAGWKKGGQG